MPETPAASPPSPLCERFADNLDRSAAHGPGPSANVPASWERGPENPGAGDAAPCSPAQARHARLGAPRGSASLRSIDARPRTSNGGPGSAREAYGQSCRRLVGRPTHARLSEPRAPCGPARSNRSSTGRPPPTAINCWPSSAAVKSRCWCCAATAQRPAGIKGPLARTNPQLLEARSAALPTSAPNDCPKAPPPNHLVGPDPALCPEPFDHDVTPWLMRRLRTWQPPSSMQLRETTRPASGKSLAPKKSLHETFPE